MMHIAKAWCVCSDVGVYSYGGGCNKGLFSGAYQALDVTCLLEAPPKI